MQLGVISLSSSRRRYALSWHLLLIQHVHAGALQRWISRLATAGTVFAACATAAQPLQTRSYRGQVEKDAVESNRWASAYLVAVHTLASPASDRVGQGDDDWSHYLKRVYGARAHWPSQLHPPRFFWNVAPGAERLVRQVGEPFNNLAKRGVGCQQGSWACEKHVLKCAKDSAPSHTLPYMLVDSNIVQLAAFGFWLGPQGRLPANGLSDHTWMEVIRFQRPEEDPGRRPLTIFLNTGRSLRAESRAQLLEALSEKVPPAAAQTVNLKLQFSNERETRLGCIGILSQPRPRYGRLMGLLPLCEYARFAGFDTVQITAAYGMQFELVDCRRAAKLPDGYAAPSSEVANAPVFPRPYIATLRPTHKKNARQARALLWNQSQTVWGAGQESMIIWQEACPPDAAHVLRTASLRPCICDRGLPVLNCGAYLSVIKQLNYTLRRGDRLTVAPMVV
jgi:hypothetical protein